MRRVQVNLEQRSYPIVVGAGAIGCDELVQAVQGKRVVVVTEPTVAGLYSDLVRIQLEKSAKQVDVIVMPLSESNKRLTLVEEIAGQLLAMLADRKTVLVALGGGVVGDVVGFAAAIYQRGVPFIQIPTTLLAMVDSSVGGKTAVNHPLGKNMIGAFYQPQLVVSDIHFLASLPEREVSAGLAEIIKHGAIADPEYLAAVSAQMASLRQLDSAALADVVARSCEIKAAVVAADETEQDVRATLNFGHTFGHAIEAGMGYGHWLHGEAVGAGMILAADLSARLGQLPASEVIRLRSVIESAGLPVTAPAWSFEKYLELMAVDKKSEQGVPRFVLLNGIGQAVVRRVPEDKLRETFAAGATGPIV